MFNGREKIFDFGLKDSVGQKWFDDFNFFYPGIEDNQFVKKTFVPNSIEGFFHVENTEAVFMSL